MWLRQFGGPIFPSQLMVFVMASTRLIILVAVGSFMWMGNTGYLDLDSPVSNMRCFDNTQCSGKPDLISCFEAHEDSRTSMCPESISKIKDNQTACELRKMPASIIDHGLESAVGINWFPDLSVIYTLLGLVLYMFILIHDMSILNKGRVKHVASLRDLEVQNPRVAGLIRRITKFPFRCRQVNRYPFVFMQAVGVVVFFPVLYICMHFIALFRPVHMSRIMISMCALDSTVCGLVLAFYGLLLQVHTWTSWARIHHLRFLDFFVPWLAGEHDECVCLCEYPMQPNLSALLVCIGLASAWWSGNLFQHTLRGLRHKEWASLFSVSYSVPTNVFPVRWAQPDGEPIGQREVSEPVQGEPAFDPFILMDEQPTSHRLFAQLKMGEIPAPRATAADAASMLRLYDEDDGEDAFEVGCCGFPKRRMRRESAMDQMDSYAESIEDGMGVELRARGGDQVSLQMSEEMTFKVTDGLESTPQGGKSFHSGGKSSRA